MSSSKVMTVFTSVFVCFGGGNNCSFNDTVLYTWPIMVDSRLRRASAFMSHSKKI